MILLEIGVVKGTQKIVIRYGLRLISPPRGKPPEIVSTYVERQGTTQFLFIEFFLTVPCASRHHRRTTDEIFVRLSQSGKPSVKILFHQTYVQDAHGSRQICIQSSAPRLRVHPVILR